MLEQPHSFSYGEGVAAPNWENSPVSNLSECVNRPIPLHLAACKATVPPESAKRQMAQFNSQP